MKRLLMILLVPCFLGVLAMACDDNGPDYNPDLSPPPVDCGIVCSPHD
jgi:hypothetical protein